MSELGGGGVQRDRGKESCRGTALDLIWSSGTIGKFARGTKSATS